MRRSQVTDGKESLVKVHKSPSNADTRSPFGGLSNSHKELLSNPDKGLNNR
jgi:hypothetical protein